MLAASPDEKSIFYNLQSLHKRIKYAFIISLGRPSVPKSELKYITPTLTNFASATSGLLAQPMEIALREINNAMRTCPQVDVMAKRAYACLILKRAEIFASNNFPGKALKDIEALKSYETFVDLQKYNTLKSSLLQLECTPDPDVRIEELEWKSTNARYPALSPKVAIFKNEKDRIRLIATQELGPGEIIGVEYPYACSTSSPDFCSHCARHTDQIYVCQACPVEYCSLRCMNRARQYHRYECGFDRNALCEPLWTVLRMITHRSLEQVIDDDREAQVDKIVRVYKSDDYYNVDRLPGHCNEDVLLEDTLIAINLLKILRATNYFSSQGYKVKTRKLSRKELFITKLLLKYLIIERVNSYTSMGNSKTCGIYVTLGFACHSCAPSAMMYFIKNAVVLRSLKAMKRGEVVSISFFSETNYKFQKKEVRCALMRKYGFICDCVACVENWLTYAESSVDGFRLQCKCGGVLDYNCNYANYATCTKCEETKSVDEYTRRIMDFNRLVNMIHSRNESISTEESRKWIIKSLEAGFKFIAMPDFKLGKLQDLFTLAYLTKASLDSKY